MKGVCLLCLRFGRPQGRGARSWLLWSAAIVGVGNLLLLTLLQSLSQKAVTSHHAALDEALSCAEIRRILLWSVQRYGGRKPVAPGSVEFQGKVAEQIIDKLDHYKVLFTQRDASALRQGMLLSWHQFLSDENCDYFDNWISENHGLSRKKLEARFRRLKLASRFSKPAAKQEREAQPPEYQGIAAGESELESRLREFIRNIDDSSSVSVRLAYENDHVHFVVDTLNQLLFSDAVQPRYVLAKAVLGALDQYSTYFPPEEFQEFYHDLAGGTSGVGIKVRRVPRGFLIQKISPDSAAARSKRIHVGDIVRSIDGVELRSQDNRSVNRLFQGPPGSSIVLGLEAVGKNTVEFVKLKRQRFTFEESSITSETFSISELDPPRKDTPGSIAVLKIPSFYGRGGIESLPDEKSSSEDFEGLLSELLDTDRIGGLVLDLRGNPGGYLEEAVSMAGLFLGNSPVVGVVEKGTRRVLSDRRRRPLYQGSVVILVDEGSASASEVFAGALKDYQRAILVGSSRTFGKGSVQKLFHLDEEILGSWLRGFEGAGVVKLTTSFYYGPLGSSPNYGGVPTHISLESSKVSVPDRESSLAGQMPKETPLVTGEMLSKLRAKEIRTKTLVEELKSRSFDRFKKREQLPEASVARSIKTHGNIRCDEDGEAACQDLHEAVAIAADLSELDCGPQLLCRGRNLAD